MDVLCTLKNKITIKNFDHVCIRTNDYIQIKIKIQNYSQKPPASSRASNQNLKDMDVLCIFIIVSESWNLEYGCIINQWPYPNQYRDAKPQSGTSSPPQSPKSELKGHGCSLHIWNQDSEPIFRTWVHQKPVIISKSRSRCQTPVRNLHHPKKPQIKTLRTWMFFALSKSR